MKNKRFLDVDANVDKAMDYSRLPNTEPYFWWFSFLEYTLISQEDIVRQYGYSSPKQIMESEDYLPFVRVDIVSLELDYMKKYYPKDLKIMDSANPDVSFLEFIERKHDDSWYDYQDKALKTAVIQWCKENNIAYSIS